MLARDDLFDGVPQYDVQMKGQSLKLPVFYRDASSVTAIFPAKASEVRKMLPSPSLRPLLLAPGIGTLAITFLEYRDTDIGPYNEIAVVVPVAHHARPVPVVSLAKQQLRGALHGWVQHLPVTTEIARIGGVEGYGYPKFLAEIEYATEGDRFLGSLHHDGRRVFGLSGDLPTGEKTDVRARWVTYAMLSKRLVEAQVLRHLETRAVGSRTRDIHLDLDDEHEIGAELRKALLGRHPILVEHAGRFRAILHAPTFLE